MSKKISFVIMALCLLPAAVCAEEVAPAVEDNIRAMDTDHDGQVSVAEIFP